MKQFYSRISISLSLLVLIVLLSLTFIMGQLLKVSYLDKFENDFIDQSHYISAIIENSDYEKITEKTSSYINELFDLNLTVVNNDEIIVNSDHFTKLTEADRQRLFNWLNRNSPEEQVLKIRDLYFYNINHKNSNFQSESIIVSKDNYQLTKQLKSVARLLITSFFLATFIIIFYGSIILKRTMRPIEYATATIGELARGNFKPQLNNVHKNVETSLNKAVEQIVINLNDLVEKQRIQQERLSTLVENIDSSLIVIDRHGLINFINRSYKKTFKLEDVNYENKRYYEIIQYDEVNELIAEVFMTEQNIRRQVILPINIERKHFEIYGAPIIGDNNSWKGILLVFHDITELKKLEKTRKDFVANVSHELKTPITSIRGFSETLLDGASEDKEILNQFLSIILKESERLQSLLQDLLDLSKIEDSNFKLNRTTFNLISELNDVVTLLNQHAKEKEISLVFKSATSDLKINGDLDRIKQLFINLIDNAISYTQENGKVIVEVNDDSKNVYVNVIDSGIGISEEEVPRIFERFYRIDKARSRDSGGTGLGLAIVKHIVEAHKGTINVTTTVGVGTTFTITIPKK